VKRADPKASILKGGRVIFNIKCNDCWLIAVVQYAHGVLMIRLFGSHKDYDKVDAETGVMKTTLIVIQNDASGHGADREAEFEESGSGRRGAVSSAKVSVSSW
jgi:hypothetical protein